MQAVAIVINIQDIDSALRVYDHIEVQKSVGGPPSYTDARSVTSAMAGGATVTGSATGPFIGVDGAVLSLDVDGQLATEHFTEPDPNTITSVIRQLAGLTSIIASNSSGHLAITTVSVGSGVRLAILAGSVNSVLGFTTGTTTYGTDQHIQLRAGVSKYTYMDLSGAGPAYYRHRLINTSTGVFSDWYPWFLGPGTSVIPSTDLIIGTIHVAGLEGGAEAGMNVTVVNVYNPLVKDGYFIAGASVTKQVDANGLASFELVQGAQVDVILEGTSIIRRITVPTTGTTFDLLDPSLQVDDPFGIQVPDLPAAVRHS